MHKDQLMFNVYFFLFSQNKHKKLPPFLSNAKSNLAFELQMKTTENL